MIARREDLDKLRGVPISGLAARFRILRADGTKYGSFRARLAQV
jgi:hypothetical protein